MNETIQKIDNCLEHIELVKFAGVRLVKRLVRNGEEKLARKLLARIYCHDNSKIYDDLEFNNLNGIIENKDKLESAVRYHRCHNFHHPEAYGNINAMPDEAIAEMVCDWWSRGCVAGLDFRLWIVSEAVTRWKVSDTALTRIMRFVDLLLDKPLKRIG